MKFLITFIILLFMMSCGGDKVYSPKPKMYPRVVYPSKTYEQKEIAYCNFSFQAPTYASIIQDKYFYDDVVVNPCWFDLSVSDLKADLHCSYFPLDSRDGLDRLVHDAFRMTNEHNVKANYIEETLIENKDHNVYGLLFSVDGPVASPIQFYLTDSTNHFFRASLYLNSKVNPDSTAPIVKYIAQDIDAMISSWEWK